LVKGLADDPERHLILVTATPHSGKTDAFRSLIGLLDGDFSQLPENLAGEHNRRNREQLAQRLVQRRREDIKKYQTDNPFPQREEPETDPTYKLSAQYRELFDQVLEFARETVADPSGDGRRQRIRWWSALALLRALASSPAAAAATLRTRSVTADSEDEAEADELGERFVFDIGDDDLDSSDTVPGSDPDEESDWTRRRLRELAKLAESLRGKHDTKLDGATSIVQQFLDDGHQPIVFCRFIETTEYLAEQLKKRLRGEVEVMAITGRLPAAERERRVAELATAARRVLVATDCLSEGINLQETFTAVLHYDLPWNPTRLEQREGRVDRFGQKHPTVRIVTYYGQDNVIDPAVLNVLVEKHRTIRRDTGISIPVPGSTAEVMEAVSQAVLEQGETGTEQVIPGLEEYVAPRAKQLVLAWDDAAEREKASRSLFAQHVMSPEHVAGFYEESQLALGSSADVEQFVTTALKAFGAVINPGKATLLDLSEVPSSVRSQLNVPIDRSTFKVRFEPPARDGELLLTRSHPLVAGLATFILSSALDPGFAQDVAARAGAIRTAAVSQRTTLLLSRFRFHLTTIREDLERQLLVESAHLGAFRGDPTEPAWLDTAHALELLEADPSGNVSPRQAIDFLAEVIDNDAAWLPGLDEAIQEAATELLHQHRAAREAAGATGRFRVEAVRPIDVLAIYVLLPDV
jgi:hypothetical protein